MKKANNLKSAPLYTVLGSISNLELNFRVIPLTKAKERDGFWIYPSTGGNKYIPVKNLGLVDSSDFTNDSIQKKAYKGYCLKSKIETLIESIKLSHLKKRKSIKVVALKNKPVEKVVVKVKSIPTLIKTEVVVAPEIKKVEAKIKKIEVKVKIKEEVEINDPTIPKNFSKRDKEDLIAVREILAGNKNQFAVLYKRYYPIINYKFSTSLKYNKELADDLTADLFVRVFEKLNTYKPDFTFNSWITRVAQNFLIDYSRKRRLELVSMNAGVSSESMRNNDSDSIAFDATDNSAVTGEQNMMTKEKNRMVKSLVENLDAKSKIVIEKYYFEDKSYVEISEETQMPLGSVKALIFRGKSKMREMLILDKGKAAIA